MANCTSCGSWIPDNQGSSSCSMCYGDIGHGKDGYYEEWARGKGTPMSSEAKMPERIYAGRVTRNSHAYWEPIPCVGTTEYIRADLSALEAERGDGIGKPLIHRYTDAHGNKMVALAEWYYDEIVKTLPDEPHPPADAGDRAEALEALKSLVYGGGNIGNDGKDDGGHRSLHGNLLFDHWQTIERALTAPGQSETIKVLVEALDKIVQIGNKDGIHRWHEEAKGDFIHGGGDQIVHKADYYVNATHVLKMVDIAQKALARAEKAGAE